MLARKSIQDISVIDLNGDIDFREMIRIKDAIGSLIAFSAAGSGRVVITPRWRTRSKALTTIGRVTALVTKRCSRMSR